VSSPYPILLGAPPLKPQLITVNLKHLQYLLKFVHSIQFLNFFSNEGSPLEPCHIHITKIKGRGMDISLNSAKAQKVWTDKENLWLLLVDGRQLSVPLVFFPNLSSASKEDLSHYELSGGGLGIHWDSLDEDLYVPNLLLGITDVNRMMKRA